jgi:hypothetical protein
MTENQFDELSQVANDMEIDTGAIDEVLPYIKSAILLIEKEAPGVAQQLMALRNHLESMVIDISSIRSNAENATCVVNEIRRKE